MDAINELLAEHEAVRITLKILKRIGQEIDKTGKLSNPEHLEQLFDFFSTFVDRCHHSKEEELLFPALEEVGVSRAGGPVGVMLKEHQQGRDLVTKMKTAINQYLNADNDAIQEFQQHANDYTTLLDFHIDKENNVLFPMALKHLPESKLAELKKGFDRIETDKIGAGKHEAFHKMLDSLGEIYLK
ncbi:MAG: hemerythrin domain-containing protein [Deltaproteobacteria bacterium]|jgi:hemerythrin-like domain-containing protein|nr:hemerythrin domain-containing protein [Deltaproteobacteria bacterium]